MKILEILVCPECKTKLSSSETKDGILDCTNCFRTFRFTNNIFSLDNASSAEYFDNNFKFMTDGNAQPEIQELCYRKQREEVKKIVKPGDVILDIGCGPQICYEKPSGSFLIGVEPSFSSIRLNKDLNLGISVSAAYLPLATRSVDCIFMFYSIHHMNANSLSENIEILRGVLTEAERVIKQGGVIVIFDLDPIAPFWVFQNVLWNIAKRKLAQNLDMYFWRKKQLLKIASPLLKSSSYTFKYFKVSMLLTFPPIFSLPTLKVPRFLYPFRVVMHKWKF